MPILIDPALKGFSMVTEYLLEHGAKVNMESEVCYLDLTEYMLSYGLDT